MVAAAGDGDGGGACLTAAPEECHTQGTISQHTHPPPPTTTNTAATLQPSSRSGRSLLPVVAGGRGGAVVGDVAAYRWVVVVIFFLRELLYVVNDELLHQVCEYKGSAWGPARMLRMGKCSCHLVVGVFSQILLSEPQI